MFLLPIVLILSVTVYAWVAWLVPRGVPPDPLQRRKAAIASALLALAAPVHAQEWRAVVEESWVPAGDGSFLYVRSIGDGPQVVIVPFALFLEDALVPLAEPGRRLVFYDPRGRGRSPAVDPATVTLDRQVADLDAVRRATGAERVAIVGWSGMGMETAVYAMRHPRRVSRLVQVAPVPPRAAPWFAESGQRRAARADTTAAAALEARIAAGHYDGDAVGLCRARQRVNRIAAFHDPAKVPLAADTCRWPNELPDRLDRLFASLLGSFGEYDWRPELAALAMPRLVIHGASDTFPRGGSEEWVAGGGDARLVVFERSGHYPFLEEPDAFFEVVDRFLDEEGPAAPE